jgi:flagellar hook-associated protein 3 FlgL
MSYFRVSTANSYDATITRISQRTSDLTQLQEKLSAGKRVLRATDDPVAATLAERESNRLMRVEADQRALQRSQAALEQAESTMGEAVDVLHRVKELIVQAGNTALSASDRTSIAQELRSLRDQLLSLANTQDTEGNALLGGLGVTNTLGKPFADVYGATAGVQYQAIAGQTAATETSVPNRVDGQHALMRNLTGNGTFVVAHDQGGMYAGTNGVVDTSAINSGVLPYDSSVTPQGRYEIEVITAAGRLEAQVTRFDKSTGTSTVLSPNADLGAYTAGQSVKLNNVSIQFEGLQLTLAGSAAPGAKLTVSPSQPDDLFATLQRTIDAVETPGPADSNAHLTQELSRAHTELETGLDRLQLVRGRLGEWLRRAETIDGQLENRAVGHEKQLSNLTDLDMVKGISDFESQQLGLQAALQSYGQVQKLSLFQYIA